MDTYSNTTRPARTQRHRILRQCSCHTVWVRLLIDKSSSWTSLGVFSSPTTIVTFHPSLAQTRALARAISELVVLHSYSFVFSFRHQFKGHVTSPYTVAADRRSAVWPQFAEAVFISGHAWTELRQPGRVRGGHFDYHGSDAPANGGCFTIAAGTVAASLPGLRESAADRTRAAPS